MEAKVIVAKCRCEKYYGIRIEKKQDDWIRTWAFPMNDRMFRKENYKNQQMVKGSMAVTKEYPGCPYCGIKGFFICRVCRRMNCWNGEESVICGWCQEPGSIVVKESFELGTGEM